MGWVRDGDWGFLYTSRRVWAHNLRKTERLTTFLYPVRRLLRHITYTELWHVCVAHIMTEDTNLFCLIKADFGAPTSCKQSILTPQKRRRAIRAGVHKLLGKDEHRKSKFKYAFQKVFLQMLSSVQVKKALQGTNQFYIILAKSINQNREERGYNGSTKSSKLAEYIQSAVMTRILHLMRIYLCPDHGS